MKVNKDAVALAKKYFGAKRGTHAYEEMSGLLNTAARAGAGGTKAGVVGLRPSGLKKASDLVDYFTPGKVEMPDRPFTKTVEETKDFKKQDAPFNIAITLPRSFCPDCDRTNRPEEGGAINLNAWQEDRPDLGIKATECMISFLCQECCEKFKAGIHDPGKDIQEVTVQGVRNRREREQAERLVRCKKNQEDYIKAMRLSGRMEIYTDGGRDR